MKKKIVLPVFMLAVLLLSSLLLIRMPQALSAGVNAYTLAPGQSVTVNHSYTSIAGVYVYVDGAQYDYARYTTSGNTGSYGEDSGKRSFILYKNNDLDITNTSFSNLRIETKSKVINVTPRSSRALAKVRLQPGQSVWAENTDGVHENSIKASGKNASIEYKGGAYRASSFERNSSGGTENILAGGSIALTNRDRGDIYVFGPGRAFRFANDSNRPADFRHSLAANSSFQATNISDSSYYIYVDGTGIYEYSTYNKDGTLAFTGRTSSGSRLVKPGQRFIITNVSATSMVVSGAYPAFSTTTQVEPPMITRTLAPKASFKVKNVSNDRMKLLLDGAYEHAEYDSTGKVAAYAKSSLLSNYSLPADHFAVFTNPSATASITIKVPKEKAQYSDSAHPALYRSSLEPGQSLEANNVTRGDATFRGEGRYDAAFYDGIGLTNYSAAQLHASFRLNVGERVALTNVGSAAQDVYAPYEAFRFSARTQPVTFKRTIEPGQTLKAVNTSRHAFGIAADQAHHYALYNQANNKVGRFDHRVQADTYPVAPNEKLIVTNSGTGTLTVSGPIDAFDVTRRSEPALYKGYLDSGQSRKLFNTSPANFSLQTEGVYDQASYKADQSLRSLDHKSKQSSLALYPGERTTITNAGASQVVLLAPYDVTTVQDSPNPALLIKTLAIHQSAEFVSTAATTQSLYVTGRHDLMDYDAAGKPDSYVRQTITGVRSVAPAQKVAVMNTSEAPIEAYGAYERYTAENRLHPVTFRHVLNSNESFDFTNTQGKAYRLYTAGGPFDYASRLASGAVDRIGLGANPSTTVQQANEKIAITGVSAAPTIIEGAFDAFRITARAHPALIKRTLQVGDTIETTHLETASSELHMGGLYDLAEFEAAGRLKQYARNFTSAQTVAAGGKLAVQNSDQKAYVVYGPYESFRITDRAAPVTFKKTLSPGETAAYVQNERSNRFIQTQGVYDYARFDAEGKVKAYNVNADSTQMVDQGDRIVFTGASTAPVTLSGSYDAFKPDAAKGKAVTAKVLAVGETYSLRNLTPGYFALKINGAHAYQRYDRSGTLIGSSDRTRNTQGFEASERINIGNVDAGPITVLAPTEAIRVTQGDDLLLRSLADGESLKAVNGSGNPALLTLNGKYDLAVYDASGQPTGNYERLRTGVPVAVPAGGYAILTGRQSSATTVTAGKESFTWAAHDRDALSIYSLAADKWLKSVNVTDRSRTLQVSGRFAYRIEQQAEQTGSGPLLIGGGNTATLHNTSGSAAEVYSPYGLFRWEETTEPTAPPAGTPVASLSPSDYDEATFYADPIDTSTGAQIINKTMLVAHGSVDMPFQAQYYSLLQGDGALGKGWTHNYEIRLKEMPGDPAVRVHWSAFRYHTFARQADGTYVSTDKAARHDVLQKNADGRYTLNRYEGTTYQFNANGVLQSMHTAGGFELTLQYGADGKLAAVTEAATGAKLRLTYDAAGRVVSVSDQADRTASFVYDPAGRLLTLTDPSGQKTAYTYDGQDRIVTGSVAGQERFANTYDEEGRVVKQTDGVAAHSTTLVYSRSEGRLTTTINDRSGNVQERVHDTRYQLVEMQDTRAGKTTYTYDAQGNRTGLTNALGQTTTFAHDDKGNLTQATDPSGQSITMTYDARGDLLTAVGPDGSRVTHTYDKAGRLLSTTDTEGHTVAYAYNAQGQLLSATDPQGGTTKYAYENNRLTQVTQSTGEVDRIGYDAAGRMTTQTDADGNISKIVYNDGDQLTAVINALGHPTRYAYDDQSNLTSVTDAMGNTTRYTYDNNAQLTGVTDALGGRSTIRYDAEGRMTGVTDALKRETKFAYDEAGHLLSETNALGASVRYVYDALGRPTEAYDALNNKVYTVQYDSAGNPVKRTDARGNAYMSTYNQLNQLTESVDPLGHATRYGYDKRSLLTSVTDAMQGQTSQTADAFGQITQRSDANGHSAKSQYDRLGRLMNETDAAGGSRTYTYNALGLLSADTDKNGRSTAYAYDAAGQLSQFTDEAGRVSYQYDANGNILSVTGSDGKVLKRTFDALDRVETYTDGDGNTIGYAYDAAGQLKTLTYPDGKQVNYAYNAIGSLSTVTDWNGRVTRYDYDANGRLIATNRPNGTRETRLYDAAGQVTNVSELQADGRLRVETTYVYDAVGNLVRENSGTFEKAVPDVVYTENGPGLSPNPGEATGPNGTGGTGTVGDSVYGVPVTRDVYGNPSVTRDVYGNPTVTWDVYGNPGVTRDVYGNPTVMQDVYGLQMTYGADNRLVTVNGAAVTYDGEGNMLTGPLNGSLQSYRYDARNRLIEAGGVSYGYDNENNRNSITVNGVTTKQIINPHAVLSQVLMETDTAGTPQARYVYGLGLIGREDAAGKYQTYHYDLRGSTVALTDEQGQVTDTYSYDTYGERLSHEGASSQPFQYNGRDGVQTDVNGLYQMRARYYNPAIKRFVNRDVLSGSIGDGLTLNRYAYVNGNPVSYIDPFGLSADGATWWETGLSFAADATPFVGTLKGIQEVFSGVDLITGEQMSVTDRVATGVGTVASVIPFGKHVGKYLAKEGIEGGARLAGKVKSQSFAEKTVRTGAYNSDFVGKAGKGLGKLEEMEISVSQKGLDIVKNHLSTFDPYVPNQMMIQRLENALKNGTPLTGADASFYMHEVSEFTKMRKGMSYDSAHGSAIEKYNVSPFSVYHPDVIKSLPEEFNLLWYKFWGIEK
ncbi:RHS repeat-associated core domain-containing protein [Saccharibacillus brassicae]|uniref:Uncharacterized protein n=1 Tax=Saccharibacillus brassicae TaxID=2583377 RepID=A0A4Y6V087_SACBS|nr:RHS repeat-associated core domain-containing protein [Saccharibacillus brassicae]QDH21685.1 hypothetical protein FFV09_13020 [Saccharibacillus brassicae]